MEITGAHYGSCYAANGNVCIEVRISVRNSGSTDFSTDIFKWEAVDSSGGIYQVPQRTSGPDAVAPGGHSEVALGFDVPAGVKLVQVRYEVNWDGIESARMSLPEY